jgi:transposase
VLLAADGASTAEIVSKTGASKPTVIAWKKRYSTEGLSGLQDRPKPGRPRRRDDAAILLATLTPPPQRLEVTQWSSRLLASELGVSNGKVAATWRDYGLRPWLREPFSFGTQPRLVAEARDVAGLYLNPPDEAVVLCATSPAQQPDQIRALKVLSAVPAEWPHAESGQAGPALLDALTARAGRPAAADDQYPRRRHRAFVHFLQQVAAARPAAELHVVMVDSYATRRHPDVRTWLARHPEIRPHFTPTTRSWLTLTEIFFAINERNVVGSGTVATAKDLMAAIGAAIDGWIEGSRPFSWASPDDEISPADLAELP